MSKNLVLISDFQVVSVAVLIVCIRAQYHLDNHASSYLQSDFSGLELGDHDHGLFLQPASVALQSADSNSDYHHEDHYVYIFSFIFDVFYNF